MIRLIFIAAISLYAGHATVVYLRPAPANAAPLPSMETIVESGRVQQLIVGGMTLDDALAAFPDEVKCPARIKGLATRQQWTRLGRC